MSLNNQSEYVLWLKQKISWKKNRSNRLQKQGSVIGLGLWFLSRPAKNTSIPFFTSTYRWKIGRLNRYSFLFSLIHEIPIGSGAPTDTETPYYTYRVVSRSRAKLVGRVNRSTVNVLGSYRSDETAWPETTRFFLRRTLHTWYVAKKNIYRVSVVGRARPKVGNNYIAVVYYRTCTTRVSLPSDNNGGVVTLG